jgi:hypothetical protein
LQARAGELGAVACGDAMMRVLAAVAVVVGAALIALGLYVLVTAVL